MWVDITQRRERRQRVMNTQKELKIQIPEGYEIDKEKSTFEKIVFKKKEKEINSWEDLEKIEGYYLNTDSNIAYIGGPMVNRKEHKNVFLNKKYVKSALALAQISQLLPYYDSKVNWFSDIYKYSIVRECNRLVINKWQSTYNLLSFNTKEEAERFLKYNEQLVKDYLMID